MTPTVITPNGLDRIKAQIPNALTASRFVLSFVVLYLLQQGYGWWAVIVFILAAFTDFPDGYLARKWQVVSRFGERYDPLVDKFLLLLPLGFFVHAYEISWIYFGLIVAREVLITSLREYRYSTGGSMPADRHGKIKVNLQYSLVGLFFIKYLGIFTFSIFWIEIWYFVVAVYTVWSGYTYLQNMGKLHSSSSLPK